MNATTEFDSLTSNLPDQAVIKIKTGLVWTVLHSLVFLITFGQNNRYKDFVTTIGNRIYVPLSWWTVADDLTKLAVIKHELVHVTQYKKFGFGNPMLGLVPYWLVYLLLPLPLGLAYFRYLIERPAYLKGILTLKEYGGDYQSELNHAVDVLTGSSYGWAWPFPKSVKEYFTQNIQ